MYSASVFSHAQKHTHTAKKPYSTTRQYLAFIYPDDIGSLQHFSTSRMLWWVAFSRPCSPISERNSDRFLMKLAA